MTLQPAERAALALWLAAARQLDPDCWFAEDPAAQALMVAARGHLHQGALEARVNVGSVSEIAGHIDGVADRLLELGKKNPGGSIPEVAAAEALLRQIAVGIKPSDDGCALAGPCTCGALELAAMIEARVRTLIDHKGGRRLPEIHYVTAFADDEGLVAPFRVNGQARINSSPRTVTLLLRPERMTSRDLWHLAYTYYHELVCHAFQGALDGAAPGNAHASCHWTEGWMDTVTRDLVLDWLDHNAAPANWLPLRGDNAVAEIWRFHEHRYLEPPGLKANQVTLRREARDAYRELASVFEQCCFASSSADAKQLVWQFSLAANSHPEADCDRLATIGANLRICLRKNKPLHGAGVWAADACVRFIGDSRLDELEKALAAIVSDRPDKG